jgi:hypothetical protein
VKAVLISTTLSPSFKVTNGLVVSTTVTYLLTVVAELLDESFAHNNCQLPDILLH